MPAGVPARATAIVLRITATPKEYWATLAPSNVRPKCPAGLSIRRAERRRRIDCVAGSGHGRRLERTEAARFVAAGKRSRRRGGKSARCNDGLVRRRVQFTGAVLVRCMTCAGRPAHIVGAVLDRGQRIGETVPGIFLDERTQNIPGAVGVEETLQARGVKAVFEKVAHEAIGLFKYSGIPHLPFPIGVVALCVRLPQC